MAVQLVSSLHWREWKHALIGDSLRPSAASLFLKGGEFPKSSYSFLTSNSPGFFIFCPATNLLFSDRQTRSRDLRLSGGSHPYFQNRPLAFQLEIRGQGSVQLSIRGQEVPPHPGRPNDKYQFPIAGTRHLVCLVHNPAKN